MMELPPLYTAELVADQYRIELAEWLALHSKTLNPQIIETNIASSVVPQRLEHLTRLGYAIRLTHLPEDIRGYDIDPETRNWSFLTAATQRDSAIYSREVLIDRAVGELGRNPRLFLGIQNAEVYINASDIADIVFALGVEVVDISSI